MEDEKSGEGQNDNAGVKEGVGPVSITNTLGKDANAVNFNAYQMNLLLWKAECKTVKLNEADQNSPSPSPTVKTAILFDKADRVDCPNNSISSYRFVPVYFFLHKTTASKITSDSLISDLLDNEHGGLINIKFTPTFFSRTIRDAEGNLLPSSTTLIFDFGPKYIEAPSLADPKNIAFVGAGYLGIGVNFEFGLYDAKNSPKEILAGAKPQGGLAIGFGVYRNWVDTGGFDNSAFPLPIPNSYYTYVIGYEFQVTNLIAISGTRSIPADSNTLGSLGTYSSVSVNYNF